jgi:hypothetical protein
MLKKSMKSTVIAAQRTSSEASSQQEFALHGYDGGPNLTFPEALGCGFSVDLLVESVIRVGFGNLETDFFVGAPRSSLLVSGGRPSFFLRCFSAGLGAQEGLVRPISAAFTFHGSRIP